MRLGSRLIGGRLRGSSRQIEPIDEPPAQDGEGARKAINAPGRYCEVIRIRRALGQPNRALTRVAANANDAVIAKGPDETKDRRVTRR